MVAKASIHALNELVHTPAKLGRQARLLDSPVSSAREARSGVGGMPQAAPLSPLRGRMPMLPPFYNSVYKGRGQQAGPYSRQSPYTPFGRPAPSFITRNNKPGVVPPYSPQSLEVNQKARQQLAKAPRFPQQPPPEVLSRRQGLFPNQLMSANNPPPQRPARPALPPMSDTNDCAFQATKGPECRRSKLSPFLCVYEDNYPNTTARFIHDRFQNLLHEHGSLDLNLPKSVPNEPKGKESICDAEILILRPGYAVDTNGNWRTVYQFDDFVQRLRVETCRKPKQPCKYIAGCHQSVCLQKYSYIRLLSFDPCNRELGPSFSMFRVPTACECQVKDENVKLEGGYGPMFGGTAAKHIDSTVKEMAQYGMGGDDPKEPFA